MIIGWASTTENFFGIKLIKNDSFYISIFSGAETGALKQQQHFILNIYNIFYDSTMKGSKWTLL